MIAINSVDQSTQPQGRGQQQYGFTLVEVLVGMLLTFAFVGTALQSIVVSTAFKVKAQEETEVNTWIQEDLENMRYEARRLDYHDGSDYIFFDGSGYVTDPVRCAANAPNAGYADLLKDYLLELDPPDIDTSTTPDSQSKTTSKTSQIGSRTYQLTTKITPSNAAPYNILEVTYNVTSTESGHSIATLYAKIIPDASFACS